jgi:hypothetical protein
MKTLWSYNAIRLVLTCYVTCLLVGLVQCILRIYVHLNERRFG